MFGSSQDRARQLAARRRRARIDSDKSTSSDRSVSSSSQESQYLREPHLLNRSTQPSSAILEQPFHEVHRTHSGQLASKGYSYLQQLKDRQAPSTNHSVLRPVGGSQRSLMEQHVRQAEYLSQVLYSNPTPRNLVQAPYNQSKLSSRHSWYGGFGTSLVELDHRHNPRAHFLPTNPATQQSSILTASTTRQLQRLIPLLPMSSRPFAVEFSWVLKVFRLPAWQAPISSGPLYDAFLGSLSEKALDLFRHLFDPRFIQRASKTAIARKWFFCDLNAEQQQNVKQIINLRGMELLAQNQDYPQSMQTTGFTVSEDKMKPYTTLYYLLDATEGPLATINSKLAPQQKQSNRGTLPAGETRSASTPILRQKEKLLQGCWQQEQQQVFLLLEQSLHRVFFILAYTCSLLALLLLPIHANIILTVITAAAAVPQDYPRRRPISISYSTSTKRRALQIRILLALRER